MFSKILCLIMGRAGSNAIAHWIHSQYPESLNAKYVHCSSVSKPTLVRPFVEDISSDYIIYRQECVNIESVWEEYKNIILPKNKIIVYSIRDPWNHVAALFQFWIFHNVKTLEKRLERIKVYIENYKRIINQYLGKATYLPKNSIFINYNKWFSNIDYRKNISQQLQLPTSENNINTVWKFSGFEEQTDATKLDVLNRWKTYINDVNYRRLFQDKELVELSKNLFIPPFYVDDDENATILTK